MAKNTTTKNTDDGTVAAPVNPTMSEKNGDEVENMNPGVRLTLALDKCYTDIETFAVIQPATLADLVRARKAKNSALLNAAQANWTVKALTERDAAIATQVLTIMGNLPTDASDTVKHTPTEILATRLWVIDQVLSDIEGEYDQNVINEARDMLIKDGYSPILADDKRDGVIATAVRACKVGTMPRGKAAQNKDDK